MGREGRGRGGRGWVGRNGRGIYTLQRRRHFLGVNRNYNIYIIPICALKWCHFSKCRFLYSSNITKRRGGMDGWKGGEREGDGVIDKE